MTRFRILVLLLVVAGIASGALLGIGHWYGAAASIIPLSVLAYLAARSEGYTPESSIYQEGIAELIRRWARVTTLLGLGLILMALLATILTMGIIIPVRGIAKIPNWVLAAINMHIPYAGFVLLCAGFAFWSGAVFWKKKQDVTAGGNSSTV